MSDAMHRPTCLLLHGFAGGPHEMEPLSQALQNAGFRTRLPVLPGHGGPLRHLAETTYEDWLRAAELHAQEVSETYGAFDVVGFSMGGLLAAYVANRFPVRRVVFLNAAVIYFSPGRFVRYAVDALRRRDFSHWKKTKETPLGASLQFVRLARSLRPEFSKIASPVLIVQGEMDPIVHPASAKWIYRRVRGPRRIAWFPRSRHMILQDAEAEEVIRTAVEFLKEP